MAGTGEGEDAVDEGREEGAAVVLMLREDRAALSACADNHCFGCELESDPSSSSTHLS